MEESRIPVGETASHLFSKMREQILALWVSSDKEEFRAFILKKE